MKAIRIGSKILKILIRDSIYYPGRLIADTSNIIARCGVLLVLYGYVFRLNGGNINNTTFVVTAWSMFFYFSFSVLGLRYISRAIMQDIRSGDIELLFNKPISYLSYRMWWQVGKGLYPFLVISIVGAIMLALIIGAPEIMSVSIFIPTFFLVVLLGVLLSLFLYGIVGLSSFWIEDIDPVFLVVDKAVMILGGSYLPIALFPNVMYKFSLFSPFGASQFITHTVYDAWATEWMAKIAIQFFWVVVVAIVAKIIFAKARKKVFVNGG